LLRVVWKFHISLQSRRNACQWSKLIFVQSFVR